MKKARLFWSYRIEQTEQWLSQMARDGYHLTSINPLLRLFSFQEGPSTATTYAIQYEKNRYNFRAARFWMGSGHHFRKMADFEK